ncbi:MAG: DUF2723 domain-containing protein [Bacteroidota bacterium]
MKRLLSSLLPTHWSLLLLAAIYLMTRNPFASFGDSLGMLYHASLGVDWATNATSHFLYVNFCALSLKLLPFLDQVLVLSLISWAFALLSLHRFGQLLKLAGSSEGLAAFLLLVMGLSFTWWRQAVMIEVYTLSCWVGLSVVWAMVKDELASQKKNQQAWLIGLWLGLALLAHIQFVLLTPVIGWHFWRRRASGISPALGTIGVTILVSSPLWILPLLLGTHSLKAVFFDQGYQDQVLQTDLASLVKGSLRSLGYLLYNFHVWVALIAWGLWKNWQKNRYWLWLAGLGGGPLWVFAMRYDVTDNYVFFLFPYFLLWLAVGAGIKGQGSGNREQGSSPLAEEDLREGEGGWGMNSEQGAESKEQGSQPKAVPRVENPARREGGRRGRKPKTRNKDQRFPMLGISLRLTGIEVPFFRNQPIPLWLILATALCLSPLVYATAWKVAEQVPSVQEFAEPKAYKGGVRYYLWPGQAYSPDPLKLAKAIYLGEQLPNPDFDRYPITIAYLKSRNLLPAQKDSSEEK